ncbi:MAG: hypothetical protein EP304_05235 [Deltaproteobacteria bacterium]|nr:MAG: hypothetical protein EP304_05235 [Deltaproteobacteria bacterium]
MTEEQDKSIKTEQADLEVKEERFPELAELQEKTQRRLRSNQRFLERFMDEDFDDLDDDEPDDGDDEDPAQFEEL